MFPPALYTCILKLSNSIGVLRKMPHWLQNNSIVSVYKMLNVFEFSNFYKSLVPNLYYGGLGPFSLLNRKKTVLYKDYCLHHYFCTTFWHISSRLRQVFLDQGKIRTYSDWTLYLIDDGIYFFVQLYLEFWDCSILEL